jgi:hypothetical protein
MEPKQANPAFFVLAPHGSEPLSTTIIFSVGFCSLRCIAAFRPTIPLPIIMMSVLFKKVSFSQKLICMVSRCIG